MFRYEKMFIKPYTTKKYNLIKSHNLLRTSSRLFRTCPQIFQKTSDSDGRVGDSIDPKKTVESILDRSKQKLFEVVSIYEEAIGLKEIREAQENVLQAEKNFANAQKLRRDLNTELQSIQSRLRNLRDEMDRLSRTDSQFLKLFTEEHEILKREKLLVDDYKAREDEERDLFFFLSASLRDSQEKERARVEKTKYLQLGLSIACTSLGIISAFLLSYFRNSSINEILKYEKEQFASTGDLMNQILERQNEVHLALNQSATAQASLHDLLKSSLTQAILQDMLKPSKVIPNETKAYRDEAVLSESRTNEPAPEQVVNTQDSEVQNAKPLLISDIFASPRKLLIATTALLGFIYFYTK